MTTTAEQMKKRTDAKIRYAQVHLDALRTHSGRGSRDDFECASQEATLFHLVGAKDALLQELNIHLGCGLKASKVRNAASLKQALGGRVVPALDEIETLEADATHWLSLPTRLRHHFTHRGDVPRRFFIGPREHEVGVADPHDGSLRDRDVVEEMDEWITQMHDLVQKVRQSVDMA